MSSMKPSSMPSFEPITNFAEPIELMRSQETTEAELCQAVIEAEAVEFDAAQTADLLPRLRDFIEHYRSAVDPRTLVAVGAAVRKYIGLLPANELETIAPLLDPGADGVAPSVELELAKMVVRKLTAVPPGPAAQFPALTARLSRLVAAYLHPDQLPRPNVAATLMNGLLTLAMVSGRVWPPVFDQVPSFPVTWFRQQLARRALKLAADLSSRQAVSPSSDCQRTLLALAECCQTSVP